MSNLLVKFEENLRLCGLQSNQTVVLGVSGGVDSVTMLGLFLKSELSLNLVVAHLNHGVRLESDKDEKLVRISSEKNGLEFISKKITPPKSGNLEEELRIIRRRFLLETAEQFKASFVAIAHNANDQAETFFLNALRGSGPAGLGAMRLNDDKLIRPLLGFTRAEIEKYAEENNFTWHDDKTNDDTAYKRNYLRHKVFPLFSEVNSNWLDAIQRTTILQRQIDDYLKIEAQKFITTPFDVKTIPTLDKPILFEILGLLYENAKGDRKDLTLQNLTDLEKLISSTAGTKSISLPGNITAIRRYSNLEFVLKKEYNHNSTITLEGLEVGENYFDNWVILAEKTVELGSNSKYALFVDNKTFEKIKIKSWKSGDKISSFGISGSKKLQDLFVDAKIDKEKRLNWPIIYVGKEIVWVPKLALSRNLQASKIPTIKLTLQEKI